MKPIKPVFWIFPVTTLVIFVQAITGALTVLNSFDFNTHMTIGYVTGVFALVTMIIAITRKPKYNALTYSSLVLFLLVVAQGLIGFSAQTSDEIVAVHFGNALALFGVSIAMVFYAFRWGRMASAVTQ